MGVLPLQFSAGQTRKTLGLDGSEHIDILGLSNAKIQPHMQLTLMISRQDGRQDQIDVLCRIDTLNEVEYFKAGGILHYVLRQLIAS
ncbi:Aconitate hydratase 1 [compost metagenome]